MYFQKKAKSILGKLCRISFLEKQRGEEGGGTDRNVILLVTYCTVGPLDEFIFIHFVHLETI